MNIGWLCPRCDTANAPQVATCGACSPQVTAQTTPQVAPQTALAVPVAGVLEVGSKKLSPKKERFQYNDPQFLEFWSVYPLHREKADAYAAWKVAVAAQVSPQTMIAAAANYAATCDRDGIEPRFRKYPGGWIRAGRWDDEEPPKPESPAGRLMRLAEESRQE